MYFHPVYLFVSLYFLLKTYVGNNFIKYKVKNNLLFAFLKISTTNENTKIELFTLKHMLSTVKFQDFYITEELFMLDLVSDIIFRKRHFQNTSNLVCMKYFLSLLQQNELAG